MASPVNIPQEAVSDLLKIANLDNGIFDTFLAAVKETQPALGPVKFGRLISQKVKFSNKEDLPSILRTVFVLFSIKEKADVSPQALANDIADSVAKTKPTELTPDKGAI